MTAWPRSDLAAVLRSTAPPRDIFLDDGGVLNDNGLRAPEWRRLVGEFMPPRLGGTAAGWARANGEVFPRVWSDLVARMPTFASHGEFERVYAMGWMREMCARVGVALPPEDVVLALHAELGVYAGERADAAIEGAAKAVRTLHSAGYRLFTASGTTSRELRAILGRMGIAGAVSGWYGPDLIDRVKHGPAFYRAVFAHAGVAPGRALVIDSDAACCGWAAEAGAHALWVDPDGRGDAPTLAALARALT